MLKREKHLSQKMITFSEIEDPRVARTRAHLLADILIGIFSAIAGEKGWEDIENYS